MQNWQTDLAALTSTIPASPSINMEEQGLNFFVTQFMTTVSGVDEGSFILSSSPLLKTLAVELPLREAVISVGLAALSNVTQDRSLLRLARQKYVVSINAVRQAVEHPEKANPDRTLKLILMLSLYEMVCCTSTSIDMWLVHLNGAAALLRQGSFERVMESEDSRPRMQFYYISMVKYFLCHAKIPPELLDFDVESIKTSNDNDLPAVSLIEILVRCMILHSKRHDMDPELCLQVAIGLEAELFEWEHSLPERWQFHMEYSNDIQNTFHGQYVVYQDIWASRDINHYFWGRLLITELIVMSISKIASLGLLAPSHLELRQQAMNTSSLMAEYVCAGAASQLGFYGKGVPFRKLSCLPPLNGVFMLLFPMSIAGSSPAARDEVSEWVIQKFEFISASMGIQRARELIPRIKLVRAWKAECISIPF
ncbi:hypothetical protein N7478_008475 [Penicillium angulare]|uniref:uncharacterized protein n=1 Tax=Penicillium angulare TaxID=116970 RepID=UPI002541BFCE|nr:uncharacterized protein N7478_008475 [Penicillium angulare]KAJ5273350.1 hypothetical protein N7478_008475 [Penicillium angulare]